MKRNRNLVIIALCALCALLTAAVGSVVPAYAGSSIEQVDIIDLATPVIGWEPDYYFELDPASAGCSPSMPGAGAIWYESQDGKNYQSMATNYERPEDRPVFRQGWYYKFVTMVQCDESHSFSPFVTVSVNGAPAEFKLSGNTMRITASYGPIDYDNVVTYVNITGVVPPVDGEGQSYLFEPDQYSHVELFAVGAAGIWYESGDGGFTFEEMARDGGDVHNFSKGHVYMLKLKVVAEPGYELAGSINAVVNNSIIASTNTRYFNSRKLGKYCEICAIFPLLEDGALEIAAADGSGMFSTYYAGKPIDAEVVVKNAKADVNVSWYYCGFDGEISSEKIADGTKAALYPLTSDDMMLMHYVLVTAEEQGTGRKAAAIIPYTLYPAGFEEDPDATAEPEPEATQSGTDTEATPAGTANSGKSDNSGLRLNGAMIVMLAVIMLLLCSTGILAGILIGKKKK